MSQRNFRLVSILVLLNGAAHAQVPAPTPSASNQVPLAGTGPLVILAPTEIRSDPSFAKGCWIRLFPKPDYQGKDDLMIAGPLEIPSLRKPTGSSEGVYWKHKAASILVGPNAAPVFFEHSNFRGQSTSLAPDTQLSQMSEKLRFMHSADSIKLRCRNK